MGVKFNCQCLGCFHSMTASCLCNNKLVVEKENIGHQCESTMLHLLAQSSQLVINEIPSAADFSQTKIGIE